MRQALSPRKESGQEASTLAGTVLLSGLFSFPCNWKQIRYVQMSTCNRVLIGSSALLLYTAALVLVFNRKDYKCRILSKNKNAVTAEWEYRYCTPQDLQPGDYIIEVYNE